MDIIGNITNFLLFLSSLNILRHSWVVYQELRKEEPQKIKLTKRERFFLGCSVSFVLTWTLM